MIATAVVLLVALIAVFTGRYLIQETEQMEAVQMARDVNRMRMEVQYEAWDLDTTCRDWARWNDLYQFAQGQNPAFIAENLYDSSLHDSLDLDFFALFDATGKRVWGRRWVPGVAPDEVHADTRPVRGARPRGEQHSGVAGDLVESDLVVAEDRAVDL